MISKIILGTVQMGLSYGINNTSGKIPVQESHAILQLAYESGIRFLDTAEAYGDAHQIVGSFHHQHPYSIFNTVTKFPSKEKQINFAAKLGQYLHELRVPRLWGIMFHSFEALNLNDYALPELVTLKTEGKIGKLGVSIYTNDELKRSVDYSEIDFIQLPFNPLDNYSQRGALLKTAKNKEKIIHTRSAFLQGLVFKDPEKYPSNLAPLKKYAKQLRDIVMKSGCTMEEICLLYSLCQPEIDQVVIGVDNVAHLKKNLNIIGNQLAQEVLIEIDSIMVHETDLLYPKNWK